MSPAARGRGGRPGRIERAEVVRAFDVHAAAYDAVIASSRRHHEHLRLSARRMGLPEQGRGLRLLDLGCGTGASTAALLDAAPHAAEVVAVDGSAQMLGLARRKNWPPSVRFVHGNAENLALAGITGPFDGILAAFLVRDLVHRDAVLRSWLGLLRPGAPIAVHEYSVRDSLRARLRWNTACWGWYTTRAWARGESAELFGYLRRSVVAFDGADTFADRLAAAGFVDVRVQTTPGWQQHVVHTFLGRRPDDEFLDHPVAAAAAVVEVDGTAGGDVQTGPIETSPTETPPIGSGWIEAGSFAAGAYGNAVATPPRGLPRMDRDRTAVDADGSTSPSGVRRVETPD